MAELLTPDSRPEDVGAAAQLLHDFNREYDEPSPPPEDLATRLTELVAAEQATVLLARAPETDEPVGVAVLRLQPSVWSRALEAYLAELYVVPSRRGQGYGRS